MRRAVISLFNKISFADKVISVKRLGDRLRAEDFQPINIYASVFQLFYDF